MNPVEVQHHASALSTKKRLILKAREEDFPLSELEILFGYEEGELTAFAESSEFHRVETVEPGSTLKAARNYQMVGFCEIYRELKKEPNNFLNRTRTRDRRWHIWLGLIIGLPSGAFLTVLCYYLFRMFFRN